MSSVHHMNHAQPPQLKLFPFQLAISATTPLRELSQVGYMTPQKRQNHTLISRQAMKL